MLFRSGPDRRGLLPEADVESLLGLGRLVRRRLEDAVIPCGTEI